MTPRNLYAIDKNSILHAVYDIYKQNRCKVMFVYEFGVNSGNAKFYDEYITFMDKTIPY